MTFWNDDYSQEANQINAFLDSRLGYLNKPNRPTTNDDDNTFIDKSTLESWQLFYNIFLHRRNELNEFTTFNQKSLQERAKPTLAMYKESPFDFISLLARLLYEYYFWNHNAREYPDLLKPNSLEKLDELSSGESWGDQFNWINKSLGTVILRDTVSSDEFKKIREIAAEIDDFKENVTTHIRESQNDFDDRFKSANKNIHDSLKEISGIQNDLNEYNAKLQGYKNDYNFTLLSRAFSNFKKTKEAERRFGRIMTWILSISLAIPPAFSFLNHIYSWIVTGEGLASLTYYLPLLTFELLIFYFMRLYYSEVRIINTQLLQIEHRLSLCEFIQDYIDKKNTDKENKESWNLFESLIFSPIQASADNIPSVIDGANAVADLAGKIMAKSKD